MIWLGFDIGPTIGMGHAMRCRSLARALRAAGQRCGFAVNDRRNAFCQALIEEGFELVARKVMPDGAALLDLSYTGFRDELPILIERLKSENRRVALIDGLSAEAYCRGPEVDLVITPYFLTKSEPKRAAIQHIAGPDYAVLDASYADTPPDRQGETGAVLISIGGSDPWSLTEQIMGALASPVEPILVTGGLFEKNRIAKLKAQAHTLGGTLVHRPDGLRSLMLQADLAILGPGLSKYEAAACNLPSVLISPDANNHAFNQPFEAAGLGIAVQADQGDFKTALNAAMARARGLAPLDGRAQIDGRGAQRLARALESLTD